MNKQVICAGHICIDITPVFDERRKFSGLTELLEPGKLIYTQGISIHTGGSVANTGLAMKILGNDVRLMGKVGMDALGRNIRDILASYGAGGLIEMEDAETSYSVVLAVPGIDRIFLHDPGANDSFTGADIPWDELDGANLFHFGYPPLMKKMYADGGAELSSIFRRVREKGIASSLDLAAVDPQSDSGKADWPQILERTLPYVDFFVPSFEELCWMLDRRSWEKLSRFGGDMTNDLDIEAYAAPLAEKCICMGCASVLIKCGLSGMYYKTSSADRIRSVGGNLDLDPAVWADKAGTQPCFEADIVRSATGSGDVSIAAFLSAVLDGFGPECCAELAAAEGAASVTSYDALGGILSLDELSRRIESGWKKRRK